MFEAAVKSVLVTRAVVKVEISVEVMVEVSALEGSVSRADRTYKQKLVSIQGDCRGVFLS